MNNIGKVKPRNVCREREFHVTRPEMTNYAEHLSLEDNGSVCKKAAVVE